MKKIVLNLKMNFNKEQMLKYEEELSKIVTGNPEVIVCPPSCFLYQFTHQNYSLGAQNVSEYISGNYTGEISAQQLASLGVKTVLINHKERKLVELINDDTIFNKVRNVLNNNMQVILCLGETAEDRRIKRTEYFMKTFLNKLFSKLNKDELKKIVIAYEPEWLDDKKVLINEEISAMISLIKYEVKKMVGYDIEVLYGGNINGYNIATLNMIPMCDGFMIGESSLDLMTTNDIFQMSKEKF